MSNAAFYQDQSGMERLEGAFAGGKAFVGFVTGGDPSVEDSVGFILNMARAGADVVEIGIPFSDPIAEGPVIQAANLRALAGGATVEGMFTLVERVRRESAVPLVFLTYLNPVFRYGYDRFFARCAAVGVDGVIIPDLPYEEQGELRDVADAHGVAVVTLIAPTSKERVKTLAAGARGFVYLVSSMGVTGTRSTFGDHIARATAAVRAVTDTPVAVGFGIHTPDQAREIAAVAGADGVIVGSAIVRLVEQHGAAAGAAIGAYVAEMKGAMGE